MLVNEADILMVDRVGSRSGIGPLEFFHSSLSSWRLLCVVSCHAGTSLDLLVPLKRNHNITEFKDKLCE